MAHRRVTLTDGAGGGGEALQATCSLSTEVRAGGCPTEIASAALQNALDARRQRIPDQSVRKSTG